MAGLVLEEAFGRSAVAAGNVGQVVAVPLAGRVAVEAEQAARQAGDGTREVRPKTGPVAAGLFDRLGELGIADVGPLTLEDKIRLLELIVLVKHHVGEVVRRAPRHLDLEADAPRFVLVFVDQLRPELGANFFFGVRPLLGVVRVDVADSLVLALPYDFRVAVRDGAFNVSLC